MLPNIKKVLYATDLSESARHAMGYAMSLGNQYKASVTVLHVIPSFVEAFGSSSGLELTDYFDETEWSAFKKQGVAKAISALHKRITEECKTVSAGECPVAEHDILVEVGKAPKTILKMAPDFDLIVMGTHGHGMIGGMIGSVARKVIAESPTPVLVVRLPK